MFRVKKILVMRSLKIYRPLLAFSVISNVLMLVAPIHMMQVYDRVLSSGSGETLLYITMIAAGCLVLYGLTESLRTQIAQRISAGYAVQNADQLFSAITNGTVPIEKSNEIMRDFGTVRTFIASRSMIGLFDLPFAPIFLCLLFLLHFQLGLVTLLGTVMLITIAWINKKSTADDQDAASKANMAALGFTSAIVTRSEDIRAMGLLPPLVERWGGITGNHLNALEVSASKSAMFYGLSKAARQILQISTMAWGAWLVLSGDMSGGMIFAASMISGRVLQPIEQVIGGWDMINRAKIAYDAVSKVVDSTTNDVEKVRQPEPLGQVTVQNISFYVDGVEKNDTKILEGVSFALEPKQLTVCIGPSGAGKSTLARIVAGVMAPSEGDVALDGCLQKNWAAEQWGECVGYVGQDILLFPGTIAENIARMATEPDEKLIIKASLLAGCHDLINSLPQGYMTKVGDTGIRLSGGQRQRIALARALYTRPKLLVLDEPNAHLDQQGEKLLMQCLQQIKQDGAAVFVITQRQQILKIADKVMMIRDGAQVDLKQEKVHHAKIKPALQTNQYRKNNEALAEIKVSTELEQVVN